MRVRGRGTQPWCSGRPHAAYGTVRVPGVWWGAVGCKRGPPTDGEGRGAARGSVSTRLPWMDGDGALLVFQGPEA